MKAKKSQITMFIIVGAVLTIMFLFLFTMSVQKPEISEELFEAELNFQTMADNLHDYRQECIERAVKDTITDYGLYPSDETKAVLESVISERVWYCIDPSVYTDQFYSLEESYPQTNVTVYSRSVIVNVLYAATLISPEGDLQKEYKEELFVFPRTASVELDEVAIVFLVSTDDRFEIRISKGSEFKDEDGQLLDELSVLILDDQDLLGFDHPNILGNVYLVTGSTVKPKVKVSIRYEDYNILDGFREEDLTLAWYDEVREVWVAVASSVDPDNNIVSGSMNSFSAVALVSGANTNNKNEKWNANWYKWPFPSYFVEHIHRPCRPYYEVTDRWPGLCFSWR